MRKKILSILLTVAICTSMVTGCGRQNDDSDTKKITEETAEDTTEGKIQYTEDVETEETNDGSDWVTEEAMEEESSAMDMVGDGYTEAADGTAATDQAYNSSEAKSEAYVPRYDDELAPSNNEEYSVCQKIHFMQ